MVEVIFLLVLIVLAALLAVTEGSLFSTDMAFGFVGVALCVIFFVLRAPEVAIAQLIVELLIFIIMIRVSGIRRDTVDEKAIWKRFLLGGAVAGALAVIGYFAFNAMSLLPEFGRPLMTVSQGYINISKASAGNSNAVSLILLDQRFLDTLGQVSLVFASAVAALAILRSKGRKKIEERDDIVS